jgi:hypothetical protein
MLPLGLIEGFKTTSNYDVTPLSLQIYKIGFGVGRQFVIVHIIGLPHYKHASND